MWRETVHSHSFATLFRHSAVLSLSAVLLRKLPNYIYMTLYCELLAHTQFQWILFDKVTLATIGKLVLEITSITTLNGQLLIPLPESSR